MFYENTGLTCRSRPSLVWMFDVHGQTEWQSPCSNFFSIWLEVILRQSLCSIIQNSVIPYFIFLLHLDHLLFSITICLLLSSAWNGFPLRRQSSGTLFLALSQIYRCMITPQHWLPHIYLTGWMPAGCGLWLCLYSGLLCIRCVHWENIASHTKRMLTTIGCEGKVQSPLLKGGCIFYFQFYMRVHGLKGILSQNFSFFILFVL